MGGGRVRFHAGGKRANRNGEGYAGTYIAPQTLAGLANC